MFDGVRHVCWDCGEAVPVAGGYEGVEERVGLERFGFELWVELAAEEEGMGGDLYDFDVGGVGGGSGEAQAGSGEDGFVLAVELVAVAVALGDFGGAVGGGGEGIGFHDAGPGSEAHGAAHLFDAGELAEFIDDAMGGAGVELAGVGVFQAADVAGVLNAGGLHTEADTEVGGVGLAGIADGVEHALNAALAEAAGDQDAVEAFELVDVVVGGVAGVIAGLEAFGFNPGDL